MTSFRLTKFALVAMTLFSANSVATTLELRDGVDILLDGAGIGSTYNGTHDAELREANGGTNYDFGTGSSDPEFTVDLSDGGGQTQVVMRFDSLFGAGIGQIALGSVINSATLFIDIDDVGSNLEIYELTSDFGSESSVTWDNFGGGVTLGVNAQATPVATVDGGGNKVTIDLTSSVASWSAGATNLGWVFISTGSDGVDFDASENSDFADRPQLFVDFTAPAPVPLPPALVMALPALAFMARKRRRIADLSAK